MHEIADMLGLGKYALANRKHTMIETLGKAWRVPPSEREQLIRAM